MVTNSLNTTSLLIRVSNTLSACVSTSIVFTFVDVATAFNQSVKSILLENDEFYRSETRISFL